MAKKSISTSSYLLKILEEQVFILGDLMARVSIIVSAMKGTWMAIAEEHSDFSQKDKTNES
jgi:hypothetical protein